MFDLTKEVTLDKKSYSLYQKLQIFLYLITVFLAVYFSYLILFPDKYYQFSFQNPNANENNLGVPHYENSLDPANGNIKAENKLIFSNALAADYSKVNLDLNMEKSNIDPESISISIRKSFQSFFYPEGDPVGFKDGALIKNKGRYFLVSEGKLREFGSQKIISDLGYPIQGFQEAADEELRLNPRGENIITENSYPDATIFKINSDYYILSDKTLQKFGSANAYLSGYDENQAIIKDEAFLKNYSLSNEPFEYADGSLITNGISAFIVSSGYIHPIDNAETFLEKGFQWEDVLDASMDEISLYEKTGLFDLRDPHPNGTIFKTIEDGAYYIVENNRKRLLPGETIARSWLKKHPIEVSRKSMEIEVECQLEKGSFLARNFYSCEAPLEKLMDLRGSDYEFNLVSKNDVGINLISLDYVKNIDARNLKISLIDILNKIKLNYGLQNANQ